MIVGVDNRREAGAALEARRLVKRFGGLTAVDDLSLMLPEGGRLGVIGPNGAGKTTLFNLLAGSFAPDAGSIHLGGRAVERDAAERRIARGLARTFQIPKPFPQMTVLENVMVAGQRQAGERALASLLRPGRVAVEERALTEKAHDLLDFLSLDRLADETASVLSGGQRKLLELARVLMAEPRVLLLDEPAAGVNPALMDFISGRIEAINARGVAILLIEHNMDVVSRLCDRVMVMAQGRSLAEGTPAEVLRDAAVVEAYLGEPVLAA